MRVTVFLRGFPLITVDFKGIHFIYITRNSENKEMELLLGGPHHTDDGDYHYNTTTILTIYPIALRN